MTLMNINDISVHYDKRTAVDHVSFSIEEGDYIAVVGENGSGKSTLIKTVVGLLHPASGTIDRCGIAPGEIGYMPQTTMVQKDFPATVEEVVLSGFLNARGLFPFYSGAQRTQALENMKILHVEGLGKKSFRDLSGGQQHRVLIARALCATKKLLVLDEPASVLDPVVTHGLYDTLRDLNENRGIAILMVSHDIHCAIEQSRKILHMDTTLRFFGSNEEYQKTELCHHMTGSCHAVSEEGGHHHA